MALNMSMMERFLALQSENDRLNTALTEAEARCADLQEDREGLLLRLALASFKQLVQEIQDSVASLYIAEYERRNQGCTVVTPDVEGMIKVWIGDDRFMTLKEWDITVHREHIGFTPTGHFTITINGKESAKMIPNTQPIIGGPSVSKDRLMGLLERHASQLSKAERAEIAEAYAFYGNETKIGNLVPFAQSVHETGWFTSLRWRKQRNPAGLGATDDGAAGGSFCSVAAGVQAQFAHLLAYAAPQTLAPADLKIAMMIKLDPRLDDLVKKGWRGTAPRWADLSGKWGSRVGYGERIIKLANELVGA